MGGGAFACMRAVMHKAAVDVMAGEILKDRSSLGVRVRLQARVNPPCYNA